MHRLILGLSAGDPRQIDHINGDTLDNRDENIRICSAAENARNRGKNRNKIGYKGVKRAHKSARFTATIYVEGKNIHLGTRDTAEEAALLYDEAAIHHFGEFAHPNFPHS
ncbi:MAG: HNH endonuclease [Alphaproteobacteria bacterium]